MNPLELKRSPYTDEEVGLGAEKDDEHREKSEIEGVVKRRVEEEIDLSGKEREPNVEQSARFKVERINDVSDHKS